MPVIGGTFSGGFDRRRFATLELFRGLAQRNKGRKTSYFDAPARPQMRRDNPGRTPEAEARSFFSAQVFFRVEHFGGSIGETIDMPQQHRHVVLAEPFQQARIAL